jgi:hypothetical protein
MAEVFVLVAAPPRSPRLRVKLLCLSDFSRISRFKFPVFSLFPERSIVRLKNQCGYKIRTGRMIQTDLKQTISS